MAAVDDEHTGVRIAGWSGLLALAITAAEFPLWWVDDRVPPFWQAAAFAEFAARHTTLYLTRTVMDLAIFGLLLVFFGGLRLVFVRTRPALEWLATTMFGVALVYVAVTLVADALTASVGLDTADGHADPTVIRALNEASVLLFGSVGISLLVLLLILASALVLATAALPRWIAWLGFAAAACDLAFVPTIYFGTDFNRGLYVAAGDGPAAIAPGAFLLWVACVAVGMVRLRSGPGAAQ
ncbi:MAG: hypothetical protein K1X88_29710 [Nannocystaceae bacterium]|nr:hypothetical protein [Nannocystaceae bacterium]